MLNNLLDRFIDYDVIVWDDCSSFDFKYLHLTPNVKVTQFEKNYGKKLAWDKFKQIFNSLKKLNYKYYFMLPDDCKPCDNFIKESIGLWESINDDKKICLSWANKSRLTCPNWTPHFPEDKGDVILSQWNDLQFMCENKFFNEVKIKKINPKRWEQDSNLGSGVGSQISNQLFSKFNMYHTKKEMLEHLGNDDSKMNSEERKLTKL
jgi:hypothetical protein